MASTNKTPKLGLNQWEPGDSVLREDFNGDNAKLEAAVGALQMHKFAYGTYTGPGTYDEPKHITVGFRPQAVLVMLEARFIDDYAALVLRGHAAMADSKPERFLLQLTDTGFEVCNRKKSNANTAETPTLGSNTRYNYLAFC